MYFLEDKEINLKKYREFKHQFWFNIGRNPSFPNIGLTLEVHQKGKSFYFKINEFLPTFKNDVYMFFKLTKKQFNYLDESYRNNEFVLDYLYKLIKEKREKIIKKYKNILIDKLNEKIKTYENLEPGFLKSIREYDEIKERIVKINNEIKRIEQNDFYTLDDLLYQIKIS